MATLRGTPTNNHVGNNDVVLRVTDAAGARSPQGVANTIRGAVLPATGAA